ncbi:MAG: atrA protein [Blastococcus sp.]|jgi:polar amino acid transport system substrate-binding protein|nr:atrA protein [Blastococcus sp.]
MNLVGKVGLRRSAAISLAAVIALGVAACGSSDSGSGSDQASAGTASKGSGASSQLHDELPSDLRNASSIVVGSVSDYPPLGYMDNGHLAGLNIDLLNKMADVLGTKFEMQNTSFDSLVPSLKSGRISIASGGTSDTSENEAVGILVDYMYASAQLAVPADNPDNIQSLADACGKTVATLAGSSTYMGSVQSASKDCTDAGKSPIKMTTFSSVDTALLAVSSGRADAIFNSSFILAYDIQQGIKIKIVGPLLNSVPIGFHVSKSDTELATALKDALQKLIDNGEYAKLLAKYGLEKSAIKAAAINAAKSQ